MSAARKGTQRGKHSASATTPPTRDMLAAQRANLALSLRIEGVGYEEIAHRCGYASRGAAHRAVQREMDRTIVSNIEELRYEEIAHRCGYASRGAAHRAVQREMDRTIVSNIEELRYEELEKLNRLHRAVWPLVVSPASLEDAQPDQADQQEEADTAQQNKRGRKKKYEGTPDLWAVDRILAISEAKRKLMGLDVSPEEAAANQPYTKHVILTHERGDGDDGEVSK